MFAYSIVNISLSLSFFFFFFNDTATTEIYTLSLHDALPISFNEARFPGCGTPTGNLAFLELIFDEGIDVGGTVGNSPGNRSEEHTSELQSLTNLVCRLLLEKKKK